MGEIVVSKKDGDFALVVPQAVFNQAKLDPAAGYELVRVKKGIWVLVQKEVQKPNENPLDAKILKMVKEKSLQERVEGKFEGLLEKEELARFKELLAEGKIVAFKLSPKYKKAVYKTKDDAEGKNPKGREGAKEKNLGTGEKAAGKNLCIKESESFDAKEKRVDQYSFEKDGFLVFKNNTRAKHLSNQYKKEIEEGKIRGIKSFDGQFYIAENALYQKYRDKALAFVKVEKGIDSKKLAEKLGVSKILAKIVCEFLKEEGEIIEKRKDQFQAI